MDERPIAVQLLSNRRVIWGWSWSVVAVNGGIAFALQIACRVAFGRAESIGPQFGSIPAAPITVREDVSSIPAPALRSRVSGLAAD
jgi:hypothetical protein